MASSHGSVAARVRAHKDARPELYCVAPRCLWRLSSGSCRKHGVHVCTRDNQGLCHAARR